MHSNVFGKICMGLFIFAIGLVSQTLAQTVLNPGDISFITVNSNPDYFEIISTKDISTGTTLFFADNAWSGSVRSSTEGSLSVTTNQTIAAGTIIQFSGVDTSSPILSPAIGSITRNGSFDLSSNGDQILVYQGIDPLDISASFIYGLGFGITNSWISSGTPTSNTSYLPGALVIGSSAINNSAKNIQYNCHNIGIYSTTFLSDINDLTYRNGSTSAYSPSLCIFDTIQPQSTINLASGQQTITSTMNIKFSIEFSEPINISSLECSDILFAGTAGGITCVSINEIAPNNGTIFEINTSVTSDGTIIANLNTGSVNDVAGNPHIVSNIINNSVTVNSTLPVITISGSTDITIAQNSLYNEEGATWTDTLDGNGILTLPTSGAVDASNLGTYILEYSYINTAGNTGTNIRTVHVTDQTPPQISGFGQSINEGNNVTINTLNYTNDLNPIINYGFDIDNNGSIDFSNTSGVLVLTRNDLQNYGITGNNNTLLPTDSYFIGVNATDSGNNIGTGIFQLKVYNTTPSANITYPIISGNIYSGNLPINWNIIDPANQDFPMNADVYYSNNNLTYFPIASTISDRTGSLSRDTSTVPDGINYRVRLRVLDDYGNYTTTSLPFKIDNTGPIITGDLSYTINEGNNVTFSLTGTTDAIAGLSGFIRNINNNLTGTSSGQISLTWSQLQSFGINNDGIYTIPVKAYDNLGNISTKNIILSINNIAPTLTISQPVSGVYSGSTPILWTTNDVANGDLPLGIKISYSNGTNSGVIIQSTGLSTPYLWNTSLIPDGTGYIITIDSSDDDSTTTRSSQTINIDNTSPIISGFNNNYIINEGSGLVIDLRNSTDNIAGLSGGYSKFIGTVNGVSLPVSTNGYRTINWSSLATYGITNGYGQSYNINISVSDAVGNISNKSGTLIVNNVTPSILITNPVTTTLTGTISILFTVIDPADTNMNVIIEYAPDPTLTWNIIGTGVYPTNTGLNRNTTTIPDNSYYIRVRAIDDQNTGSTIAGPFNIDNIPNYVGGGGGSAGGSSGVPNKDYCPNGDFTTSFYDNSCGSQPIITTGVNQTGEENDIINFIESDIFNPTISDGLCFNRNTSLSITNSKTTITNDEFKKALTFLYSYKMTSFNTIDTFKPYTKLTREQAAKIFSNFAMNVLCRKPDTSLQPSYNDINNSNETLKPYIVKAYQLGLMKGGNNNNFRPFDTITKAELNAVLVRMILKSYLNEEGEVWYAKYNQTATKLGIITKGAGSIPVNRHDATLMMFRAYKNQDYSLQNINYESYVIDNRNQLMQ